MSLVFFCVTQFYKLCQLYRQLRLLWWPWIDNDHSFSKNLSYVNCTESLSIATIQNAYTILFLAVIGGSSKTNDFFWKLWVSVYSLKNIAVNVLNEVYWRKGYRAWLELSRPVWIPTLREFEIWSSFVSLFWISIWNTWF